MTTIWQPLLDKSNFQSSLLELAINTSQTPHKENATISGRVHAYHEDEQIISKTKGGEGGQGGTISTKAIIEERKGGGLRAHRGHVCLEKSQEEEEVLIL